MTGSWEPGTISRAESLLKKKAQKNVSWASDIQRDIQRGLTMVVDRARSV